MTPSLNPDNYERTYHYELQFNAVCLCEWNVGISARVFVQVDADKYVAALHKEAIRVLMRALGPAIANQIQMAREEGWKAVVEQHDD